MLDVLSIKLNNIPMVVFKIIALDLLVIRHCRVNCMSLCVRKTTIWVPTMSDTNRAVQSQEMVRGWKFWV